MRILSNLDNRHLLQLHKLYQKEWWTEKRTLEETKHVVKNSQIVIAMVDNENRLQAFVRVLTDYLFKALIFDVIVSDEHRGKGLGKELMNLVQNHSELQEVKHFELYCLPKMVGFYEAFGFTGELENLVFMRKRR